MIISSRIIALLFLSPILLPVQETDVPIKFGDKMHNADTQLPSYANDKMFEVKLPESPRGPIWTMGKENPPLSAAAAIKAAIKKRKELVPDDERFVWGFQRASLVPWDFENGYWYWEIVSQQSSRSGVGGGSSTEFRQVVLMDGTVVEPEISDWDPDKR